MVRGAWCVVWELQAYLLVAFGFVDVEVGREKWEVGREKWEV